MDPRLAERMTDHVVSLAAEHRVTLRWAKSWRRAEAIARLRLAVVPLIRHPYDYLFALHELGHVASEDAQRWNDDSGVYAAVLVEGAAWAWAAENADPVLARRLSAKDWNTAAYAFRTYVQHGSTRRLPAPIRRHRWAERRSRSSQEPSPRSVRHSGQPASTPRGTPAPWL